MSLLQISLYPPPHSLLLQDDWASRKQRDAPSAPALQNASPSHLLFPILKADPRSLPCLPASRRAERPQ